MTFLLAIFVAPNKYIERTPTKPDVSHTRDAIRSFTKTVRIACDPQAAFEFLLISATGRAGPSSTSNPRAAPMIPTGASAARLQHHRRRPAATAPQVEPSTANVDHLARRLHGVCLPTRCRRGATCRVNATEHRKGSIFGIRERGGVQTGRADVGARADRHRRAAAVGKSTFAERLADRFGWAVLGFDDFYLPARDWPANIEPSFPFRSFESTSSARLCGHCTGRASAPGGRSIGQHSLCRLSRCALTTPVRH